MSSSSHWFSTCFFKNIRFLHTKLLAQSLCWAQCIPSEHVSSSFCCHTADPADHVGPKSRSARNAFLKKAECDPLMLLDPDNYQNIVYCYMTATTICIWWSWCKVVSRSLDISALTVSWCLVSVVYHPPLEIRGPPTSTSLSPTFGKFLGVYILIPAFGIQYWFLDVSGLCMLMSLPIYASKMWMHHATSLIDLELPPETL